MFSIVTANIEIMYLIETDDVGDFENLSTRLIGKFEKPSIWFSNMMSFFDKDLFVVKFELSNRQWK